MKKNKVRGLLIMGLCITLLGLGGCTTSSDSDGVNKDVDYEVLENAAFESVEDLTTLDGMVPLEFEFDVDSSEELSMVILGSLQVFLSGSTEDYGEIITVEEIEKLIKSASLAISETMHEEGYLVLAWEFTEEGEALFNNEEGIAKIKSGVAYHANQRMESAQYTLDNLDQIIEDGNFDPALYPKEMFEDYLRNPDTYAVEVYGNKIVAVISKDADGVMESIVQLAK